MKRFINCRAYAFDPDSRTYAFRSSFTTDGSRFARDDGGRSGAGDVIDLAGATVAPAFADCHVHLADTGFMSGERDLRSVRGVGEFGSRVAALPKDAYLLAGNYDESRWHDGALASAAPLERYHAERFAMLVRIDGHSSLVNARTLAHLALDPGLSGIERDEDGAATGRLFLEANWIAQARFIARIPAPVRRAAAARGAELALAQGAVHLHAQLLGLGSRDAYAGEIAALRALPGVKIYPKICERDPALAASLGLPFVGGDVFLDGSIGSGTAATCEPYRDRPGRGTLALEDDEVERYFSDAERLGVAAGVHAIGDRAIEQCLRAWERVASVRGRLRQRHFIEHFEMASRDHIERAARLGLYLSMQPQFDAAWGAPGGMYEARFGIERARTMNAFGTAVRAGAVLCGGDDSPVCALSPLAGMAAACEHAVEGERLTPLDALTMYAYDAARFGHAENRTGLLRPGYDADFVVLDRDPFADGTFAATRVLQTWSSGACVYPAA